MINPEFEEEEEEECEEFEDYDEDEESFDNGFDEVGVEKNGKQENVDVGNESDNDEDQEQERIYQKICFEESVIQNDLENMEDSSERIFFENRTCFKNQNEF